MLAREALKANNPGIDHSQLRRFIEDLQVIEEFDPTAHQYLNDELEVALREYDKRLCRVTLGEDSYCGYLASKASKLTGLPYDRCLVEAAAVVIGSKSKVVFELVRDFAERCRAGDLNHRKQPKAAGGRR